MHKVIKLLGISAGLWLLLDCTLSSILPPPVSPVQPRPLVVAAPTPGTAHLHVTQVYTQPNLALPSASHALTLTPSLGLDFSTLSGDGCIIVIAEVSNTGHTPLDLAQATFTLEDHAGQVYARTPKAELALSVTGGLALALPGTPPLAEQTIAPNARATGFLAFTASPGYTTPLRLVARIPGCPALQPNSFTLED